MSNDAKKKHLPPDVKSEGKPTQVSPNNSQMDLFTTLDIPLSQQKDYSNTVDIYDAIPKYVWGKTRYDGTVKNSIITRKSTIRGKRLTIKIKPALIEQKNGEGLMIYPGQREELVEDALRKLAVNGQGVTVNAKAGVTFSLHELQKELKRMGHSFSIDEIKESLMVGRQSALEVYSEDGKTVIDSGLYGLLGLSTRDDYLEKGKQARCFVQFNPLVNESILNLTFRQYNYKVGMDIRSPLARYIYKRMSQYWTQASEKHPYEPSLLTFLEQSPRGVTPKMKDNIRAMKSALDHLLKANVISHFDEDRILEGKQKVIDIRYTIYPHKDFIKDIIKANKRSKDLNQNIEQKHIEVDPESGHANESEHATSG